MGFWSTLSASVRRIVRPPRAVKRPRVPRHRYPTRAEIARLPTVTGRDEWAPMRGKIIRIDGDQVEILHDGSTDWAPASTVRPRKALAQSAAILHAKGRPHASRAPAPRARAARTRSPR